MSGPQTPPPSVDITGAELGFILDGLSGSDMQGMLAYLSGRSPEGFVAALKRHRRDLVPERLREAADELDRIIGSTP